MLRDSHNGRKAKSFSRTAHLVEDGLACRVYGTVQVKKVTGNLHITTLGHGYLSWEHTDHNLMNLSRSSFLANFPLLLLISYITCLPISLSRCDS
jgi:hypothetical protein